MELNNLNSKIHEIQNGKDCTERLHRAESKWSRSVILDIDLAELYHVDVAKLKDVVIKNRKQFPSFFMIELTGKEYLSLMLQKTALNKRVEIDYKCKHMAFTEQGIAILNTVFHSQNSEVINIAIMRAFSQIKQSRNQNAITKELKELKLENELFNLKCGKINTILLCTN